MLTVEMIKNHDFGTIHLQRFQGANYIRVWVIKSTSCTVDLLNENGQHLNSPSFDVETDEEVPAAIDAMWLELQRRLHYGRTGRRDRQGLFFYDPLPEYLK